MKVNDIDSSGYKGEIDLQKVQVMWELYRAESTRTIVIESRSLGLIYLNCNGCYHVWMSLTADCLCIISL